MKNNINTKNISESTIKIINKMVEKVNEMNAQELFNLKQSQMETPELIEKTKNLLSELCKTGGQSLTMRVPPSINDFDMLVCETLRRLAHLTTEVTRLREALEKLISEMGEREKEYIINYKTSGRPEHWNGKLQELSLIKKALTQALTTSK